MSGFFGVVRFFPERLAAARRAAATLKHRGPDQWGEHCVRDFYLGCHRLAISDLSERGRQPFVDSATGVAVVVNGEVANHPALRELLGPDRFSSSADGEIFLQGYLAWGLDGLLARVDGFFSAAIHDPREDSLYLIKDRFGKFPLYYGQCDEGSLVFASEAKALLDYATEFRRFDLAALQHWMVFRGSTRGETIFKGIHKVPAASYLHFQAGRLLREQKYYDLPGFVQAAYPRRVSTPAALDAEVEAHLMASIRKRFQADVPVGLQLSGGVDSSLIAVLAREMFGGNLKSFTATFPGEEYRAFDEAQHAAAVARKYGLDHREIPIEEAAVAEAFPQVVWHFDGMLDIPNAIPIYLMAREAKQDVSVILSGEGADDLFGGAEYIHAKRLAESRGSWKRWLPEMLFSSLPLPAGVQHRLRSAYLEKYYGSQADKLLREANCFISAATLQRLFQHDGRDPLARLNQRALGELPFEKRMQTVDQCTYLNFLLERQDKASMAGGVEVRLPFLDQALVEAVVPIAADDLYDLQVTKRSLKRLLARRMGEAFAHRRKVGFPLPISKWLYQPGGLGQYIDVALAPDFPLWRHVSRGAVLKAMNHKGFSLRQITYGAAERIWLRWFLAVLGATQAIFNITEIETS